MAKKDENYAPLKELDRVLGRGDSVYAAEGKKIAEEQDEIRADQAARRASDGLASANMSKKNEPAYRQHFFK